MKAKISLKNIISYLVGNYRYKIYYSNNFSILMREHIKEQIDWRISMMDDICHNSGSCKLCGCETTALQMADKACDKPCYPPIMRAKDWLLFKEKNHFVDKATYRTWHYHESNRVFKIINNIGN